MGIFLLNFIINFSLLKVNEFILNSWDYPKSVYVSPDNKMVYVCNLEGNNLLIINREKKEVFKRIKMHGKPVELTFTEGGRYVWVSLLKANSIAVYDTVANEIIQKISVGKEPKILRADPFEKYILVANWDDESVSIIDISLRKEVKRIHLGRHPRGIEFHPEKNLAYVAVMGAQNITVISLDSLKIVEKINKGLDITPRHLAITKDGKYLYVSCNLAGSVQKIDLEKKEVVKTLSVGKHPRTIALSPVSEKYLFVVNYNSNSLMVINSKNMEKIYEINTFPHPIGVDISKDEKEVWVANYFPKCSIFTYLIQEKKQE